MRTYTYRLTVEDVREAIERKKVDYYRVMVSPEMLLRWMLDGIPSSRIVEVTAGSSGLILDLDSEPLPSNA